MAKGKNLNPADALRKAQRKKELKKNKVERQKNRDFALVKKDTNEIEDEISELEKVEKLSGDQVKLLKELRAELASINKKKEEYVSAHPEQRGLVYKRRRDKEKEGNDDDAQPTQVKKERNLFNKDGLPRHPERSIYYDPLMNPYGMPPPGMPYVQRALLPGEVDSEAESEKDSGDDFDDDIIMPKGPPPRKAKDGLDEVDSDVDTIPMPEGPPPGSILDPEVPPLPLEPPPLPPGPPPNFLPPMPPFPPNLPFVTQTPFLHPPPFPGFPSSNFPPPPPPPPGFFSERGNKRNRQLSASAMQDPLSSVPHQIYQAHLVQNQHTHSNKSTIPIPGLPHNPNLPPRPESVSRAHGISASSSAVISAEPQLRDLKKESTAFVPSALKRKKGASGTSGRVNAAPSFSEDNDTTNFTAKPDLLVTLREKLGPMASDKKEGKDDISKKRKLNEIERPKDDYDKFLEEMGDVLGQQ